MARRDAVEKNELKINDNISNSEITLYFKMPTPQERQGYSNMAVQRHRNKVKFLQEEARLKYGMKIITGFKAGDFERKVDGKYIPMSSDEGTENFFEEWRDWVQVNADDLIMLLAAHVFDSPAERDESEDVAGN